MKANEAPEKIYLEKVYPDNGVLPNGLNYIQNPNDIEYTRTDSFFEKAKDWFITHVNIQQDVETNEDGEPLAGSYIKYAKERFDAANEMFENFKNYMKGE